MKNLLSILCYFVFTSMLCLQIAYAQRPTSSTSTFKKYQLRVEKAQQVQKTPNGIKFVEICSPSSYFKPLVQHAQKLPACKVDYEIKNAWNDIEVQIDYEILTPFKDGRKTVWLTSKLKYKGHLKYDFNECIFEGKVENPANGKTAFIALSPNNNGKTTFKMGNEIIRFISIDEGNYIAGNGKSDSNTMKKYRFRLTAIPNCSYIFGGKTYH